MAQPVEPAARALQRVRDRHAAGPDGNCVEDGQPWPCRTMHDTDGPPDSPVDNAINRVRTAVTAAEQQKPSSIAEFKRLVRDALDPPPPAPPVQPPVPPPAPEPPLHVGTGR